MPVSDQGDIVTWEYGQLGLCLDEALHSFDQQTWVGRMEWEHSFATKSTGGSVGTSNSPSGRKTVSVSIPMNSLSLGHRIL